MITRELIEKYKEQSPEKYEQKKEYFEAILAQLEPKEIVEESLVKKITKKIKK